MIPPGFSVDAPVQNSKTHVVTMAPSTDPTPGIVQDDEAMIKKQLLASSASTSMIRMPQPSAAQTTQYAAFRGLFVVQSATEARHVRYAMDVNCPELQLQLRVTERYNSFYLLRKRLLKTLKRCHVDGARPNLSESSSIDFDFYKTLRHPCCAGCSQIRKTIKSVPFPKRPLVFTTADDVDARPPQLEIFLDTCIKQLVDWQGCVRGRKFACVVLGKFLSLNLLFHIFQQLRLTMLAEQSVASNSEGHSQSSLSSSNEDAGGKHEQEPHQSEDTGSAQAITSNQLNAV